MNVPFNWPVKEHNISQVQFYNLKCGIVEQDYET